MLRAGMFLGDRYEILEQIGSGGMSEVYKAKCHKLNRYVAIKVLKAEFSQDAGFVGRFQIEAQSAAGLSHPNIVNVYDVGDEGDLHYIVMELVEGITLKNYIAKKGRLDIKESIGIALQVAQGIGAAHQQHIIHRDIKPQNMIISRDGKVKVTDFGIAKAVTTETINSNAVGSVHYISPEQARGNYCDERSDIYSLGITMYEMVTGRVPFEGDNTVSVALAHLHDEMVSPSFYNVDVPIALEKIILKCTEKKPERRYNSIQELISDLRRALITPDEDFVKLAPMDNCGQTVMIGSDQLRRINQESGYAAGMRNQASRTDGDWQGRETPPAENRQSERRQPDRKQTERKQAERRRVPDPLPEEPDDDGLEEEGSPRIEKFFTAIGIGVAVLLVAILVFVIYYFVGRPSKEDPSPTTTAESTLADTETLMPKVAGLLFDEAEQLLDKATLEPVVTYEDSDDHDKDVVISQEFSEGEVVKKYSRVKLVVSNGSNKVDLTKLKLTDVPEEDAKRLLEKQGLKVERKEENNETVEKGYVIQIDPADRVEQGGTVTLTVSLGPVPQIVKVPKITGQLEEIAIGLLEDSKLTPGAEPSKAYSDTVEKGHIISQDVEADTEVEEGSTVNYVVSDGPEPAKEKYYASINVQTDLKSQFGPGSSATSLQIYIRVKQIVDGSPVYQKLQGPTTITASSPLSINYSDIEGAEGITDGVVQIVDVTTEEIYKEFNIIFEKRAPIDER